MVSSWPLEGTGTTGSVMLHRYTLQQHRLHQHVEVNGGFWHNNIVFGDGEVVDPGGGRELAQRDLGNLLPFMAFPLLLYHLVPITCHTSAWALSVMRELACSHPDRMRSQTSAPVQNCMLRKTAGTTA